MKQRGSAYNGGGDGIRGPLIDGSYLSPNHWARLP
jgi:hypothetical protein